MHRVASVPQQASRRLGALDPTAFDALTSHAELVVGRASLPIPDLAALQVGDVIVLDARIADPLELRIQHGATTLRAAIGTTGPNRAAKIVSHPKS
jgi:flagellar motor switch protein FliM